MLSYLHLYNATKQKPENNRTMAIKDKTNRPSLHMQIFKKFHKNPNFKDLAAMKLTQRAYQKRIWHFPINTENKDHF